MLQAQVRNDVLEDEEFSPNLGNLNVWGKTASSKYLHFARLNPEVGGLCGSCIRFQDCTYPKTASGAISCDEYSR